jgi:hypothetical protein
MSSVENQCDKFRSDPLMVELSAQNVKICYAGFPYAKAQERRQSFLKACASKRLSIVIPSNGLNFELSIENVRALDQEVFNSLQ